MGDIAEFVQGCLTIKGQATAIEMAELKVICERTQRRLARFMDYAAQEFELLQVREEDTCETLSKQLTSFQRTTKQMQDPRTTKRVQDPRTTNRVQDSRTHI